MIKILESKNEMEKKQTIEKINKVKSWLFEKKKVINKTLLRMIT